MGEIYCYYSTSDYRVRYVGQTERTAQRRLDQTVTKALENEPGQLFEWIRNEWRKNEEVLVHVLQEDVIPAKLNRYEQYWIDQFCDLLNVLKVTNAPQVNTTLGNRVYSQIMQKHEINI